METQIKSPDVVGYFQAVPLAEAEAVLAICEAELQRRRVTSVPAQKGTERRKRGSNKAKAGAEAGKSGQSLTPGGPSTEA